jgi:hypothetical protein
MIKVKRADGEVKRDNSFLMVTSLGTLFFSAECECV